MLKESALCVERDLECGAAPRCCQHWRRLFAILFDNLYADGNMSKEEFIRQRDAYRAQEDERMEQIQRLRTEKNQIFQPVKKDADNLQAVMDTVGKAGDVMHLSQNVVETFIDRIEVFNDERVKIRFPFEDVLAGYAE